MYFERLAESMGLTHTDMTTYGAEDMEELISILQALDRANGVVDPWRREGGAWERMMTLKRRRVRKLAPTDVPVGPGVMVFFDGSVPVFVGEGVGKRGLRGRMQQHRATGDNLSSSTLRASVAVEVLGVSRWTARQRSSVLPSDMIEEVNEVLGEFEVAWLECDSPEVASELKRRLWEEYKPEYNIL
jgi:hypothetical protein